MKSTKKGEPHSRSISDDEAGQAVGGRGTARRGPQTWAQRQAEQRQHDREFDRRFGS